MAQTHMCLTLHSGEAEKQIQGSSHLTRTRQISTPYSHSTIFLLALGEQHVLKIGGHEVKNEQTVTWLEFPLASMLQGPDKGRQREGCLCSFLSGDNMGATSSCCSGISERVWDGTGAGARTV